MPFLKSDEFGGAKLEIYKNSYAKNEDTMFWELHEIRHGLHKELSQKVMAEIKGETLRKLKKWNWPQKPS